MASELRGVLSDKEESIVDLTELTVVEQEHGQRSWPSPKPHATSTRVLPPRLVCSIISFQSRHLDGTHLWIQAFVAQLTDGALRNSHFKGLGSLLLR
jgi:hypothetical protein